jgi:lipopolysaccharide export system ATP-binding protein
VQHRYCIASCIFVKIPIALNLVITTKDLVKTYRNRTVVNHVSINVKQGEIVGLLGPNGAGKTTTFYMVVGLIKPDEGEVFLNDQEITKLPMYKRAQTGIGYLPQEASVFRKLSVEDNIMAVLEMTNMSKRQRRERLEALLEEFNLRHVRKNNGDSLSGGERRRTEIARALAVDPKFILLDEPFAGVDPIAVEDIQSNVARLKYKNIGILITDHNVNETLSICDRAYLLIEGKIFKHGTAEELAANEQVRRLYLGTNFELRRKDWILEMGMKEHAQARAVLAKDRTIQYLSDYIIEVDKLLTLSDGELQERIAERDFFKLTDEVLNYIKEYGAKNHLNELDEYADKIKELNLEQQLKQSFLDNLTNTVSATENATNDIRHEEAFNETLKDARNILEKVRLIIADPAVKEVLSE